MWCEWAIWLTLRINSVRIQTVVIKVNCVNGEQVFVLSRTDPSPLTRCCKKRAARALSAITSPPPPFTIPTHLDSRTTTRDARRSIGSYNTSHHMPRIDVWTVDLAPERYVEKTDTIKELYFDRTKTINRRCSRWNGDWLNHHRWFCKFSFWDKRPPSLHGREKWIKP